MTNLVIVESPAKAKTINKYLGKDYEVLASFGHVRDLPSKDGSVDPDNDFAMLWELDGKASKRVSEIAAAAKGSEKVILATDPDREGEAISWHILEILKSRRVLKDVKVERVTFNAITKQAVDEAMRAPRPIDQALVDAYLARRALDYLVGFNLSPVLWRKLPGARSAGRVQSVALRLVCDREMEIERFVAREYWSIVATLKTDKGESFEARLVGADGRKITRLDVGTEEEAKAFKAALDAASFEVTAVESKPARRNPYPPFTTSTLQQEASRKLGMAPAIAMRVAQKLYEGVDIGGETVGLITYMRTDGVQMAPEAIGSVRSLIANDFGDRYLPGKPRVYSTKAKNAQEAHEAIRPTDVWRTPEKMRKFLGSDEFRLYELIWKRTMASQMESAELERTTVDILAKAGGRALDLRATGQVVRFDGFLTLYTEDKDDDEEEDGGRLPAMRQGDHPTRERIAATQHFTEPPPRYTEASLVKKMEELGIGRPSTYASTLQVLRDREYVRLEKKRLVAEDKGRLVTSFLESFFARYVEFDFTANLENELDRISNNEIEWKEVMRRFWEEFSAAIGGTKELRTSEVLDKLDELLGPTSSRRRRTAATAAPARAAAAAGSASSSRAPAPSSAARTTPNAATRAPSACRLRKATARRRAPSAGWRAAPRRGPGDGPACHGAERPLRPLRAARRRRKAEALLDPEGAFDRRDHPRGGAEAPFAAPRGRQASGGWRTHHRQQRPFRPLRAARQDLREPDRWRGRSDHRPQPRRGPDRHQARQGPGPLRPHRTAGQGAGRASRRR